jgi:hypothetical protein
MADSTDKATMFWCKVHSAGNDVIAAICDNDLIGKEIGGKRRIEVSKSFYGGELVDGAAALDAMKKATIGNIIGKDIVGLAEKSGFITKENIIFIDGVPHAQFVKS